MYEEKLTKRMYMTKVEGVMGIKSEEMERWSERGFVILGSEHSRKVKACIDLVRLEQFGI